MFKKISFLTRRGKLKVLIRVFKCIHGTHGQYGNYFSESDPPTCVELVKSFLFGC